MTREKFIKKWLGDLRLNEYTEGKKELMREDLDRVIEFAQQQVKNCLIADVVGSLPALSADFESIIARSYPIKDSEPSEYFETLKHAGNECAEWVHHKIKTYEQ